MFSFVSYFWSPLFFSCFPAQLVEGQGFAFGGLLDDPWSTCLLASSSTRGRFHFTLSGPLEVVVILFTSCVRVVMCRYARGYVCVCARLRACIRAVMCVCTRGYVPVLMRGYVRVYARGYSMCILARLCVCVRAVMVILQLNSSEVLVTLSGLLDNKPSLVTRACRPFSAVNAFIVTCYVDRH